MSLKVQLRPQFRTPDKGDGGIRRVVEAQRRWLPEYDIEIVDDAETADLVAIHGGGWPRHNNKPFVVHCHGLYWDEYQWDDWAHNLNSMVIESMRQADCVTAPSEWVANTLRRGMHLSPFVIGHGIEPSEWLPGDNRGYVLWNKTRIDPVCDPEPVTKLAELASGVDFVSTYGNRSLPNLEVTGRLPYGEAKELIRNAGVYLCTSRETYGIGTLEAMACGVPILGWRWGGQQEFVEHGSHGYLAVPGEYDDLVEGLHYCLQHRAELARNCIESVPVWRDVVRSYAELYRGVSSVGYTKKVSVIITCYKLAQFLEAAVKSVERAAGNVDYEVLIVDDCSPDNTAEVAAAIARDNGGVRYVQTPENLYLAGALNYGIARSVGEYIIPLDADNMLGDNCLPVLVEALDRNRALDIAYGRMEVIEQDGKRYISSWPPTTFNYRDQMQRKNQVTSTALYRRKVWERTGGYRRRCRTAEDADLWCRASSLGLRPGLVTDMVCLIYQNRLDSMSHTVPQWDWTAWYPWSYDLSLTPFAAPAPGRVRVPSYDPPIVTVVIPVGPGHTEIVIDALDSLYAQTFRNWEVVVVNASGQDIPYLPPWVKLIDTKGNVGPAKARNVGIAFGTAPMFLCLDADDFLAPKALELMTAAYKQHGGYVYSDWIVKEKEEVHRTEDYNPRSILHHLPHAVTALCSRSMWKEVGGFDETIEAWEDWDFFIALNVQGYCGTRVPEPLLYYRMQGGNRREELYAKRETLKQEIAKKWRPYILEGKPTMACGGCQKGGGVTYQQINQQQQQTELNGEMVLLRYVVEGHPGVTYRGPKTGQMYRFGSDESSRVKYVYKQDAEKLVERGEFQYA